MDTAIPQGKRSQTRHATTDKHELREEGKLHHGPCCCQSGDIAKDARNATKHVFTFTSGRSHQKPVSLPRASIKLPPAETVSMANRAAMYW